MRHPEYPKVSVIISTFDRAEKLDCALESVHAQTFDDFEVIVVDDCSPPAGTEFPPAYTAVLDKWGKKFDARGIDTWAYRLSENSGYQCMPKNRGIEKAAGDYIAYLDDDNTWRPNHLASLVAAIEGDFSTDMVYSRLSYHNDDGLKSGDAPLPVGDTEGTQWNPALLSQRNYIDTSTILHSKGAFWRLVRDSGFGWDETLRRFGDWNLVWRWAVHGLTAKLVDEVTVDYYWHSGSLQLTRPSIEVPICFNYAQYQAFRRDRNQEIALSPVS